MKVLVVHPGPHFSVADVYAGLIAGLKANGCEVASFNLDDRLEFYIRAHVATDDGDFVKAFSEDAAYEMAAKGLEVMCYEWWPDVVIVVSGFFIPPKVWAVLARRPHHVVYWATESPYEDDRQSRPARYVNTVVLNDPTNLEQFRADVNPNTHYFPHSYNPKLHYRGPAMEDLRSQFAFVGTGFPSRIEWLEQVDWTGIDVLLGGNWEALDEHSPLRQYVAHAPRQCMDNATTANVYRSTEASLNLYRKEHSDDAHADGWAVGPREIELAACGTFFFRESRPEGDDLFPRLPQITEPAEFGDQLRWWLNHPSERLEAAKAARLAIVDRTFSNTAARLLRLVDAAGPKIAA